MSGGSSLVQELVNEMGPNNPALAAGQYNMMPQQGQQQGQPGNPMTYNPNFIPPPGPGGMMPPGAGGPGTPMAGYGPPPQMMMQPPQPQPQMMMPQQPMMMGGMGMGQGQGQMMEQPPAGYDYSEEQQMREVSDMSRFGLDGRHRTLFDRAMDQLKMLAFLAVAYVVVSLPQLDAMLVRTVPLLGTNVYYALAVKGGLLALAFYGAKYFDLI